jgi:hypothetical protein
MRAATGETGCRLCLWRRTPCAYRPARFGRRPPLRLVADLQDLGFFGDQDALALVEHWLSRALPAQEIRGLAELTRGLAAGEDLLTQPARAATCLLAHFLAGTFDPAYRESLKLLRLRFPFSDAPRPWAAVRAARRAFFPARAELSAIYGAPGSRPGLAPADSPSVRRGSPVHEISLARAVSSAGKADPRPLGWRIAGLAYGGRERASVAWRCAARPCCSHPPAAASLPETHSHGDSPRS